MPTKDRSQQLNEIARSIIERAKIDPANPPEDARPYIKQLAEEGACHIETARSIWARTMRRLRHPAEPPPQWGGQRQNAGRKPDPK